MEGLQRAQKINRGDVLIAIFVTSFFCLFGVGMGSFVFTNARDLINSFDWKQANGQVISATVETSVDSEGDTTYRALVTYFYYAGDNRYEGNRVRFGDSIYTGSRGAPEKTVDRYPANKQIKVYYDPNSPKTSVIERRPTMGMILFLMVSLISGGVGLVLINFFIKTYLSFRFGWFR